MEEQEHKSLGRVIKFRVWDKSAGKMLDPDRWGNDLMIDMDGELKWYKEADYAGGHLSVSGTASLVLMQFTGMKDHMGTDIYEGDIVDLTKHMGAPVMIGKPTGVKWNDKRACWDGIYPSMAAWQFHYVLGNIYEHPHLTTSIP